MNAMRLDSPNGLVRSGQLGIKRSNLIKKFVEEMDALAQEEVQILEEEFNISHGEAVREAAKSTREWCDKASIRANERLYSRNEVYDLQVY